MWLKAETINTVYDFKLYCSSKIKVSECKRYYQTTEANETKYYKRNEVFDSFEEISSIPNTIKIVDCIAYTYKNNQITVSSVFNIKVYLLSIYLPPYFN